MLQHVLKQLFLALIRKRNGENQRMYTKKKQNFSFCQKKKKKKKKSMQNKNSCAKDISISMSEKFVLVHVSILCHQNYFPSETGGSGSNFSFRKYEYTTIEWLNLNTNG